jgi:hypothetical protein
MAYTKQKALEYQRKRRQTFAAQGLCTRCGSEKVGEYLDCADCRQKSNGYVQRIVKHNLKAGKCRCGNETLLTKRTCQRCYDWSRNTIRALKKQVLSGYGNKCACCGEKTYEFLSIDHKNNDGAEDRRRRGKKGHGGSWYRALIAEDFPDYCQILCFNCNMSKEFSGYCPHEKRGKK